MTKNELQTFIEKNKGRATRTPRAPEGLTVLKPHVTSVVLLLKDVIII